MGYTYVRDTEARLRNEQNTVLDEVKTSLATAIAQIAKMDATTTAQIAKMDATMTAQIAQMDGKFDKKFDQLDKDIFKSNTVGVFIIAILVTTQPKLLEFFSFIASIFKFSV